MATETTTTDKRLDDLREDVNRQMDATRDDVNRRIDAMRDDFSGQMDAMRADIRQIRNWMFAGGIGLVATLIATLLNIFIGS